MKKIGAILLTSAMVLSTSTAVWAQTNNSANEGSVAIAGDTATKKIVSVDNGHGRWNYGTSLTVTLKKKAYSNLDHNTKDHSSSCEIDGNYNWSGWEPARTTSRSQTIGDRNSVAYCNWKTR